MIKEGKSYAPVSMKIVQGGAYTQYTLSCAHRVGNKYYRDGYLNVLAKGTYGVFREGDEIKIKHIVGVGLRKWNSQMFFSVYAEIEYKSAYETKASVNEALIEELPEDLI